MTLPTWGSCNQGSLGETLFTGITFSVGVRAMGETGLCEASGIRTHSFAVVRCGLTDDISHFSIGTFPKTLSGS